MASYYFYALLPAWEADHALSWTKSSTLTVNWMAELLEALGLLFAGPLADYIEPVQLIILEGLVAISGIFVTSTLQSASSVICAILSVAFLKGILWPSLGSIIFHSLRKEQSLGEAVLESNEHCVGLGMACFQGESHSVASILSFWACFFRERGSEKVVIRQALLGESRGETITILQRGLELISWFSWAHSGLQSAN